MNLLRLVSKYIDGRKIAAVAKAHKAGRDWAQAELAKGTTVLEICERTDNPWSPGHPFDIGAREIIGEYKGEK